MGAPLVATENLILHELTSEVPSRAIIPLHAWDGRTAVALAGVAGALYACFLMLVPAVRATAECVRIEQPVLL
jgi:hypothetical protein